MSLHGLTVLEADLSGVVKHCSANQESFARDGVNLTFTACFLIAMVAGSKPYLDVNSS